MVELVVLLFSLLRLCLYFSPPLSRCLSSDGKSVIDKSPVLVYHLKHAISER